MKTFQEISERISQSISLKIVITGFLILVMLIPAGMIQGLISERQFTRDSVVREISDKWGQSQTISGPVLAIPYFEYNNNSKEIIKIHKTLYVLPEILDITSQMNPEIRYRGTYKVIVYESVVNFNGNFNLPNLNEYGIIPENVNWDKACLLFGISDMRGIQQEIETHWNKDVITADPGILYPAVASSGFTSKVNLSLETNDYHFLLNLRLNGSENLYFTPVGKTTNVKITSPWSTPSFSGSFLPDNRTITDNGFEADWTILHLNRNFPQFWNNQTYRIDDSSFGVNLLFPVDEYQKSMRSAKYAIMFIALTYLIFLLVEVILKKRVHPVQYLLVSVALLLFYTLLLSLSEQIGFSLAYLISSLAIVSLVTAYSHSIFKSVRLTIIVSTSLIILYTFLFVILQMEDYSLLFGSIGLFVILGFVMYLSKKVDWYGHINSDVSQNEINS